MKSRRAERVADLIAREIAMMMHTESSDHRFLLTTVTGAKISSDLRVAHIYVSILGDESKIDETINHLKTSSSYFRREIGRRLKLRYTPEIRFVYDDTMERAQRIFSELDLLESRENSEDNADEPVE